MLGFETRFVPFGAYVDDFDRFLRETGESDGIAQNLSASLQRRSVNQNGRETRRRHRRASNVLFGGYRVGKEHLYIIIVTKIDGRTSIHGKTSDLWDFISFSTLN